MDPASPPPPPVPAHPPGPAVLLPPHGVAVPDRRTRPGPSAVERLLATLNVTAALATIAGVGFYLHDAPARQRERLIQERELLSRSRDDLEAYRKRAGTTSVGEFDDGNCAGALDNGDLGKGCQDMDPELPALPNSIVHGLAGSDRLFNREDLSGIRVDAADLSLHAFEHTNLTRMQLNETDLRRARLDQVTAGAARLRNVDASGACLSDVSLENAWLQGTSLRRATLRSVDLSGTVLVDSDLSDAKIESSTGMEGAVIAFSSLRNAKVRLGSKGPLRRCLPEQLEHQAGLASRGTTASIVVPWMQLNPTSEDLRRFRASAHSPVRELRRRPPPPGFRLFDAPPETRYVTLAYVDARGADIDLTTNRLPVRITFANICTDQVTRIRPAPPSAALDCGWMSPAAGGDRAYSVPPLAATPEARQLVKTRPGSLAIVSARTAAKVFLVDLGRPRDAEWRRVLEGERHAGRQ